MYSGILTKAREKQAESMLQYLLDMLSVQSHAAFSIVTYASINQEPSEFAVTKVLYMVDVNHILDNQFDEENQYLGVRAIFDRR